MIPKVIHYCWISGDPFPEKIQKCVDSWKRVLPDYEVVLWDYAKIHALNVRWCEEAIACKKYAFAADYIRFYALYNYGGIYLDSDVEVLKPFDDLLELKYFVGKENSVYTYEAAIMGAEKGMPWVKACFDYYTDRAFINVFGEPQVEVLPKIMEWRINANYALKKCQTKEDWVWDDNIMCLFPVDWFSPKPWNDTEPCLTENTYCIHHFTAGWKKPTEIPRTFSQKVLGWCKRRASFVKHNILHIHKPFRKR